jgi:hypothetical protein
MWRSPTRVPRNELLQSSTNNIGATLFSKSPATGRVVVPADVLSRGSWLFILLPVAFTDPKGIDEAGLRRRAGASKIDQASLGGGQYCLVADGEAE